MLFLDLSFKPFKFAFNIRIPLPVDAPHVFSKHWHGKTSVNKGWEAEVWFQPLAVLLELDVRLAFSGEDHAGLRLGGNLLGLFAEFIWQDNRHWNYDEDRWFSGDEEEKAWKNSALESEYDQVKKEALPLLTSIRDSFLYTEDGPSGDYTGVSSEADYHHFDEICKYINKFKELENGKSD